MPPKQIEPEYISPVADGIWAALETFCFVLPSLECEGLYAKDQSPELQRYRSEACIKLGFAISRVWVEHYQDGRVDQNELKYLRTAVARSNVGLTGGELEGLLSTLGVRHKLRTVVNPQHLVGSKYRRRKPPTA